MNAGLSLEIYRELLQSDRRDEDKNLVPSIAASDRFDALKATVRRKRKLPGSLAPLSRPYSPPHRQEIEDVENLESPTIQHSISSLSILPPLEVRILERKRLFLNSSGQAVVGVEEILQYQEISVPLKQPTSPLHLIAVPRKCVDDDEVALMPCHSLQYRDVPSLSIEQWKEPIRDRNKDWALEERNVILSMKPATTVCKMSRRIGNHTLQPYKGKWRRWEAQKLHLHRSEEIPNIPLGGQHLIYNQGAMITNTYCILSIYAIGLYGRLYSEGIHDRTGESRFLRIEAYDPQTCHLYTLQISIQDMEWAFKERPELLIAGKKHFMLKALVTLLYFDEIQDDSSQGWPTLRLSSENQLNASALRRQKREERLRLEEQERLRAYALLMSKPRRARHRILCRTVCLNGYSCTISIYHLPTQAHQFVINAYHPVTSCSFHLNVGMNEAAMLARVYNAPHQWSIEQKVVIATTLISHLHFRAIKSSVNDTYRMALALGEDRMGPYVSCLPLMIPLTDSLYKEQVIAKYMKDGIESLRIERENKIHVMNEQKKQTCCALQDKINQLQTSVLHLQEKDLSLQDEIDTLDSGTLHGDKSSHEIRKEIKYARKTIKDDLKGIRTSLSVSKHELEILEEQYAITVDKLHQQYEKNKAILSTQAITATMFIWFHPQDRSPRVLQSHRDGNHRQTTLRHPSLIHPLLTFLVGGVCQIQKQRIRYAVSYEKDMDPIDFYFDFYHPQTNERTSLRLSLYELLSLTKQLEHVQREIPLLMMSIGIQPFPPIVQQLIHLQTTYHTMHEQWNQLQKRKKNKEKRNQLFEEMIENQQQQGKLMKSAPWNRLIRLLTQRLEWKNQSLTLNRCLYCKTLPLVSIDDQDTTIECLISIFLEKERIQFQVQAEQITWEIEYPQSIDLIMDCAFGSYEQQQIQLETIAMTLLLYTNEHSGQRDIRFEA